ncbi:MAG: SMC-Scp complex subunit ScpB [Elusimicrobia bacterium RIFCSPLOWO2_01_FULL_54_10]|nr:MAG: SMC-Scp complex subunit ScpB [Elusimicrobia bacterium RIFCSPLOWO2_01_FULL_54_10]
MDNEKLKSVVECLLFVTNRPLSLQELSEIAGETQESVQAAVDQIQNDLADRKSAVQVAKVAEGVQFASNEGYGYWVKKLFKDQTLFRLSQSAMETLSIIAYKQPITRAEIEEIRGVEVIGVLETLTERKLVKVAGRKESVGRPLLYATTQDFLKHFNLWKVSDLPSLEDLAKEAERKLAEPVAVSAAPMPEGTAPDSTEINGNSNA